MSAIYSDLEDKTVLVTGGGSGIGEWIVREFARQKSRVAFIDIADAPSILLLLRTEFKCAPRQCAPRP